MSLQYQLLFKPMKNTQIVWNDTDQMLDIDCGSSKRCSWIKTPVKSTDTPDHDTTTIEGESDE